MLENVTPLDKRIAQQLKDEMMTEALNELTDALSHINNDMQVLHDAIRHLRLIVEVTSD